MLPWEGILLTEPSLQALRFVSNLGLNLQVTNMILKAPYPYLVRHHLSSHIMSFK